MNPNRQMEYRPRGRGDLVNGNRLESNGYMRQQITGLNLPSGQQQVYPQADLFVPPRVLSSTRPSISGHPNNIQHQAMANFNDQRPIFNGQRSPNMVPAANFPPPSRYPVAPGAGPIVASSPTNFIPRMQLHTQQQPFAFVPSTTFPVPVVNMAVPPYSIYGHAVPINEMPQFNIALTTTTNATATPLTSSFQAPATTTGTNQGVVTTTQQQYSDCSSASEDEERPQDLRVNKLQPQQLGSGVPGPTGQWVGAVKGTKAQPQGSNNHKKFQYKAWTEPEPGCSTAARPMDVEYQEPSTSAAALLNSSTRHLEEMVSELRLSPFITREQAASRLRAVGNISDVQREIDAFSAIIRCGSAAGMLFNRSTQPPPFSGGVGETVSQNLAGSQQPEQPNMDEDMGQTQQRQSVIKGHPKKK